jgi:lipid-binding SYLF domain-containing protein
MTYSISKLKLVRHWVMALALMVFASTAYAEDAEQRAEIDTAADAAIVKMFEEDRRAERLAKDAIAWLVFPEITKAGLGIGGEGGKGVLRVGGESAAYYKTTSISFGAQAGFQSYSYVLFFYDQAALDKFRSKRGFELGVDGSVAILEAGVTAEIDTSDLRRDMVGIVFNESGLMANATVEGSKLTELDI